MLGWFYLDRNKIKIKFKQLWRKIKRKWRNGRIQIGFKIIIKKEIYRLPLKRQHDRRQPFNIFDPR